MDKEILSKFHDEHPCCKQLVLSIESIKPQDVLDIGCGDGRDLAFLLDNGLIKNGVGIDDYHTPNIFSNPLYLRPTLVFYNAEITDYLRQCHSFIYDCVISNNSFEHLSNPEETLVLVSRCLHICGYLFITLPYKRNHWCEDHKYSYDEESLIKLVSVNFHVLECKQLDGGNMYILAQKI